MKTQPGLKHEIELRPELKEKIRSMIKHSDGKSAPQIIRAFLNAWIGLSDVDRENLKAWFKETKNNIRIQRALRWRNPGQTG